MFYYARMNNALLEKLKAITPEEERILAATKCIDPDLYHDASKAPKGENFVIDSAKLLEKGRLIEIRPHTRFAHFPPHSHNYVELVYMYSGSTTHILNGTDTIVLQEGDLLFMNQSAVQEILPAKSDDIAVNFIILPEFFESALSMMEEGNLLRSFLISSLTGEDSFSSYLHFKAKDILPVQNLMENMIWNLVEKKKETNLINQATMSLVFKNLSSFATELNQNQESYYEQQSVFFALKYIDSNYRDASLAALSKALGEPEYYVSRLLKKHTGCSFKELLQKRRLEQAAYLLSNTTLSTVRVMEEIGYNNSSYFHKIFRSHYGRTPKEYRR